MTEYAWRSRKGRLVDSAGPAWITTTPAGHNWIFTLYERARDGDKDDPVRALAHGRQLAHSKRTRSLAWRGTSTRRPRNRNSGALHSSGRPRLPRVHEGEERRAGPASTHRRSSSSGWTSTSTPCRPFSRRPSRRAKASGIHVIGEHYIEDGDTYKMTRVAPRVLQVARDRSLRASRSTPTRAGRPGAPRGRATTRSSERAASGLTRLERTRRFVRRVNVVNGLASPMLLRFPRLLVDPECVVLLEALESKAAIRRPENPTRRRASITRSTPSVTWRTSATRFASKRDLRHSGSHVDLRHARGVQEGGRRVPRERRADRRRTDGVVDGAGELAGLVEKVKTFALAPAAEERRQKSLAKDRMLENCHGREIEELAKKSFHVKTFERLKFFWHTSTNLLAGVTRSSRPSTTRRRSATRKRRNSLRARGGSERGRGEGEGEQRRRAPEDQPVEDPTVANDPELEALLDGSISTARTT